MERWPQEGSKEGGEVNKQVRCPNCVRGLVEQAYTTGDYATIGLQFGKCPRCLGRGTLEVRECWRPIGIDGKGFGLWLPYG